MGNNYLRIDLKGNKSNPEGLGCQGLCDQWQYYSVCSAETVKVICPAQNLLLTSVWAKHNCR